MAFHDGAHVHGEGSADAMTPEPTPLGTAELAMRVGLFVLLGVMGMALLPRAMMPLAGVLVASALSSFGAGAIANGVVVRIYEHGRLADLGLGWSAAGRREFLMGIGCGAAAAAAVVLGPVAVGLARFERTDKVVDHPAMAFAFVSIALLFGAFGEEMLFHGYAFQVLVRSMGAYATILPVGVLFGVLHMGNENASWYSVANTVGWGILLGYACWRTSALWLPIGMHFGWNFVLPLLGANLSGFTMGVTGYRMRWSAGKLWSGGGYGPEASLQTTLAVVALFWVVTRLTRSEAEPV
jgi:membrane protease YdiL (CAAX protease family)